MKKTKTIIILLTIFCSLLFVNKVYADYQLVDYDSSISIDDSYEVFIKGKDNSLACNKLGIDEAKIESYMDARNAYFMATTTDFQKNIILTRTQDLYTKDYYNLTDLDSDIVDALADGYSVGFKAGNYSIEKINDITYMIFKYDLISAQDEHLYYLKYKTIYNGYDYTVYIQKYGEITPDDEAELKNVINNFEIRKIEKPSEESKGSSYLIWIIIFLVIGVIIFILFKKNKNKNNKSLSNNIVVCPECGCKVLKEFDSCPRCGKVMKK